MTRRCLRVLATVTLVAAGLVTSATAAQAGADDRPPRPGSPIDAPYVNGYRFTGVICLDAVSVQQIAGFGYFQPGKAHYVMRDARWDFNGVQETYVECAQGQPWSFLQYNRVTPRCVDKLNVNVRAHDSNGGRHLWTTNWYQPNVCFDGTSVSFNGPPQTSITTVTDVGVNVSPGKCASPGFNGPGGYADTFCQFDVTSTSTVSISVKPEVLGTGGVGPSVNLGAQPKHGKTRLVVRPDGCYEISGSSDEADKKGCL